MSNLSAALHIEEDQVHSVAFCRVAGEQENEHFVAVMTPTAVKLYVLHYEIDPSAEQPPAGVFSVRRLKRAAQWTTARVTSELRGLFIAPEINPSAPAYQSDANREVMELIDAVLHDRGCDAQQADEDPAVTSHSSAPEEAGDGSAGWRADGDEEAPGSGSGSGSESEPKAAPAEAEAEVAPAEPEAVQAAQGDEQASASAADDALEETPAEETTDPHAARLKALIAGPESTRLSSAAIVGRRLYLTIEWRDLGVIFTAEVPEAPAEEPQPLTLLTTEICLAPSRLFIAGATTTPAGIYLVTRTTGSAIFVGERASAPASLHVPASSSDYYRVRFGQPFEQNGLMRHVMPPDAIDEIVKSGVEAGAVEGHVHQQLLDSLEQHPEEVFVTDGLTDSQGYLWLAFANGVITRSSTLPSTPKSFETVKKGFACLAQAINYDSKGRPISTYRLKRSIWNLPSCPGIRFPHLAFFPGVAVNQSRLRSRGEDMAKAEWPSFIDAGSGCVAVLGLPPDSADERLRMTLLLSQNCALVGQPSMSKTESELMVADVPGQCALPGPEFSHVLHYDASLVAIAVADGADVKALLL